MAKSILFDTTKCTGCRGCQVACKQWNGLKAEATVNTGTYENPPDLSPDTWLKMRFTEVGSNGRLAWVFTRRSCMHCTEAACVKVCPTNALYHHDLGFVAYDKNLCSGCGYCVEACPFKVPRMSGSKLTGKGKMEKCLFCRDRVTNGLEPACVKTCPTGALSFGDLPELQTAARAKVEALGGTAQLYGEKELDGLHVLYILSHPPEVLDSEGKTLPVDPKVSDITTAWKDILQPIGYGVIGLVAVGLALNYMAARARMTQKEGK